MMFHLLFTWRFLIYCQPFLDAVWPKGHLPVFLKNVNENLVRNWISIAKKREYRIHPKKSQPIIFEIMTLTCSWFSLWAFGDGLAYPHQN